MRRANPLVVLTLITFAAAACGPAAGSATRSPAESAIDQQPASPAASPAAMASPVDAASLPVAAAEESGAPGAAATPVAELAAWQTIELTDVRSSETFTLADLAGTLIVIEPMAIWCSNCLRQQQEVAKALKAFDADEVVYISLGVDPGEDARALGSYADEHDFGWRFAVSPRSLSRALARTFGDQVLAPPSTPRVIITPDGRVIGPAFGIADSKAVEMELREHLS